MQIIAKSDRYTDEQIDAALAEHIKDSFAKEMSEEEAREVAARAHAKSIGKGTVPGLGKCVAVMPAREFFRLQAKYGAAVVHSKEFLQFFNRKHADLSPNKA